MRHCSTHSVPCSTASRRVRPGMGPSSSSQSVVRMRVEFIDSSLQRRRWRRRALLEGADEGGKEEACTTAGGALLACLSMQRSMAGASTQDLRGRLGCDA